MAGRDWGGRTGLHVEELRRGPAWPGRAVECGWRGSFGPRTDGLMVTAKGSEPARKEAGNWVVTDGLGRDGTQLVGRGGCRAVK